MSDTIEELGRWRTQGLYDVSVASRLTGVSSSSIQRWLEEYPAHIAELKPDWKDLSGHVHTQRNRLSFLEMVEVLMAGKIRASQGGSYGKVRKYRDGLAEEWGTQFPFAHCNLLTHTAQLPPLAVKVLELIDYEDGFASRWCPFGKDGALALDPRRAGGQPAIKGRRLRVLDISDYFAGGDSIESLARNFYLEPMDVEAALRFALRIAS